MITRTTSHGIGYVNAASLGKIPTLCQFFRKGCSAALSPTKENPMLYDALMNCPAERRREVPVIDGGHAGSIPAMPLCKRHPRFHIDELLLPSSLPLFDSLAARDETKAVGMIHYLFSPANKLKCTVMTWKWHRMNIRYADKTAGAACR